jgi:hypothetical protein
MAYSTLTLDKQTGIHKMLNWLTKLDSDNYTTIKTIDSIFNIRNTINKMVCIQSCNKYDDIDANSLNNIRACYKVYHNNEGPELYSFTGATIIIPVHTLGIQ